MADALIRRIPVLIALGALIAACSGGGAVTTPGATSAPATGGAATPAQTAGATSAPTTAAETAAATTPEATAEATADAATPAASMAATDDVEGLVPTQVGGITLEPESIDLEQFLLGYPGFDDVIEGLGKAPSDATIIQAQGSNAGELMFVQAFRVAGADPTALMDSILTFWETSGDETGPITIGGKELIVQGSPNAADQYKTYYYPYGDVVFRLAYNGDNFDEQMAALAAALP